MNSPTFSTPRRRIPRGLLTRVILVLVLAGVAALAASLVVEAAETPDRAGGGGAW